jgi:L-ribulokinase
MAPRYAIGVDFGTMSGRALLVDVRTGRELTSAVWAYANGVIDERLPPPHADVVLEPDWALQDPDDYRQTLRETVPAVLRQAGVDPADVIGLGIDFTACTMLPTLADGTPLCRLPELRGEPHAWVKLWKHHAAQPEADRINELAAERGEPWLARYGGRTSSEWFVAKSLQILDEAPTVYRAADRLIEAADWVIWQLTGVETRNSCTAGYKALWDKADGFPSEAFFGALAPGLATLVDDKLSRTIAPIGTRAGELTAEAAAWTGLRPGTAIAVANVDAHVSVPAATVTAPGRMVAVMGTSICHLVLGTRPAPIDGICGVVEDGILPGLFGFEAGQAAVGDILAWYVEQGVPGWVERQAQAAGTDVHAILERDAARLRPGESGLLALDWWNGNRSVLVDADLAGLLVGTTLLTRPAEVYRALIEATAFGTRVIVEAFERAGVAVEEIVACGGLPERNRLLMQVFADVTGRPIPVAASSQTPALGAAMFGAVAAGSAAGGHASIGDAAAAMARLGPDRYLPDEARARVYERLFAEYRGLHDLFGRGGNDVMKRLKSIRADVLRDRPASAVSPP